MGPLKLIVQIIDRKVVEVNIHEVIVPTSTGEIGIANGHIPLLSVLDIGVVRYKLDKNDRKWVPLVIPGGIVEVKNNTVIILSTTVEIVKKETKDEDLDLYTKAINELSDQLQVENKSLDKLSESARLQQMQKIKRAGARCQAHQFLDEDD